VLERAKTPDEWANPAGDNAESRGALVPIWSPLAPLLSAASSARMVKLEGSEQLCSTTSTSIPRSLKWSGGPATFRLNSRHALNVLGSYCTERFVLRLSPRIHQLVDAVSTGIYSTDNGYSFCLSATGWPSFVITALLDGRYGHARKTIRAAIE
jgi:hypothetical protein